MAGNHAAASAMCSLNAQYKSWRSVSLETDAHASALDLFFSLECGPHFIIKALRLFN